MSGVKRILRGPWLWIGLAGLGVILALQFVVPNGGYKEVQTSTMASRIKDGDVKKITFVDGDQQMRAELKNGKKYVATWIDGTQKDFFDLAQEHVKTVNGKNPQPSLIGSLLATILPFVFIVVIFLFLMNQVQGGG